LDKIAVDVLGFDKFEIDNLGYHEKIIVLKEKAIHI